MKKIKLLYGLEAAGGGALKHLVYLVTNLDKEMFDISVVISKSRSEDIDAKIYHMRNMGVKIIFLSMCRNISPLNDFRALLSLLSIINREKYDIVHAHSSKAGGLFRIAGWLCKVPRIYYTPHCFYFQGKSSIKKNAFLLFERILAKITTGIIVSDSENVVAEENNVGPGSRIIINNAINFEGYSQSEETIKTKAKYGIRKNTFIVGAIGRLVAQKDWETYIFAAKEVLRKHNDIVFLIVGEGELEGEIRKLIFKLDLENKVILKGYVKEIHKIYGILDAFVNTSLWEGLPYVFLEAMIYKKPIIATNAGSYNTIINDKTGFVTPVKDYRYIANKIIKLIENKQMAVQMGENGLEWLTQKYSFELFIQKHTELYIR
jgi:glycosyltransferase involved in cell wall biosynthesis